MLLAKINWVQWVLYVYSLCHLPSWGHLRVILGFKPQDEPRITPGIPQLHPRIIGIKDMEHKKKCEAITGFALHNVLIYICLVVELGKPAINRVVATCDKRGVV